MEFFYFKFRARIWYKKNALLETCRVRVFDLVIFKTTFVTEFAVINNTWFRPYRVTFLPSLAVSLGLPFLLFPVFDASGNVSFSISFHFS